MRKLGKGDDDAEVSERSLVMAVAALVSPVGGGFRGRDVVTARGLA
jgi:hypothetical protein